MHKQGEPCCDRRWRKSRIALPILRREEEGNLTTGDVAVGHKPASDNGGTPRLARPAAIATRVVGPLSGCLLFAMEIEHTRTHAGRLVQAGLNQAF
jgi:hypothetical protein